MLMCQQPSSRQQQSKQGLPVSLPRAATHCEAATAAAEPPEDPPGTLSGSHGLQVTYKQPQIKPCACASAACPPGLQWSQQYRSASQTLLTVHVVNAVMQSVCLHSSINTAAPKSSTSVMPKLPGQAALTTHIPGNLPADLIVGVFT